MRALQTNVSIAVIFIPDQIPNSHGAPQPSPTTLLFNGNGATEPASKADVKHFNHDVDYQKALQSEINTMPTI